ncbi:E3 ubiquitin-protein ligase RNF25-like protein [Drosera capensis]
MQFVEADIEIQATSQYPDVPPAINVVDSKGLDEDRLEHLRSSLHRKAADLASCLMLVALCEEAVEKVSAMNHPDGNCPLCLYPLVLHDEEVPASLGGGNGSRCKMTTKIRAVGHHLPLTKISKSILSTSEKLELEPSSNNMRSCPICRKVFHVEDIEHVINLAGSQMSELNLEKGIDDGLKLIASDSETSRRHQFEGILQSQKERGGIIEPRKDGVLFSSLSITDLVRDATPEICSETITQNITQNQTVEEVKDEPESSGLSTGASKRKQHRRSRPGTLPVTAKRDSLLHSDRSHASKSDSKRELGGFYRASSSQPKHPSRRKYGRVPQTETKEWTRKDRDGDT